MSTGAGELSPRDVAGRAWGLMQEFVDTHSRHGAMADALGFRLGAGRGKILFALRRGPMTLSELASSHGFDAPYATLVVDKLQARGLVERRPHPEDRRRRLVALTAAGDAALATVDSIRQRPPGALEALDPDQSHQLLELMTRLIDADRTST